MRTRDEVLAEFQVSYHEHVGPQYSVEALADRIRELEARHIGTVRVDGPLAGSTVVVTRERDATARERADQWQGVYESARNRAEKAERRAERMEAAIRTVRDAYNEQRSDSEKDAAWIALMQTLDATPTVRDTST